MDESFCWKCGSKKVIKKGKSVSKWKSFWKQRFQCLACNHKFISKKKHLIDYEEKEFVYKTKPIPKIDWSAYNKAQTNEKLMIFSLIDELLDLISMSQEQKTGRPAIQIRDMVFCMLIKIYTKTSSRAVVSDLELAKRQGYINHVPCYSTLMLYFNDERLQKILKELVHLSGLPLKDVEEHFSIDSSGFSTSQFGRWFDFRFRNKSIITEERVFRKAHIMVGVKTNVITAIEITTQTHADSPQLKALLKKTVLNYDVKEVSADKAYLSINNLELIDSVGAVPLIPFKKNSKGSRGRQGMIWKKMFWYQKNKPQEFYERYYKRANVESTFNMIKQKFTPTLMTKNFVANVNEIMGKALCHNLRCLIYGYFKLGINKKFAEVLTNNQNVTY